MYKNTREKNQQLIDSHAHLVKKIAHHLKARLPASVQIDDLIQVGLIGLLDAGKHYDPSQGAQFDTYATIRIRGAMLDEVRRSDWIPKSVHKRSRELANAIHKIESRTGREAKDIEVAMEMGVSLDEYYRILNEHTTARILHIEDLDVDDTASLGVLEDHDNNVVNDLIEEEKQALLKQEILRLNERERLVMALYYDSEMNLKEIGRILGISESRVSQLLSQAQHRLKARLS